MQIDEILHRKSKSKGKFSDRATLNQMLKGSLRWHANWQELSDDKKEALEMIMDKISMIMNANPESRKTWFNVAGYAKLIADTLPDEEEEETEEIAA